MAVTRDSIRTRFPGVFDAVADTAMDAAIAEAVRRVNTTALGTRADDAVTYLSAHLIESTKPGRASGAVAQSAGSVSHSFAKAGSSTFEAMYLDVIRSAGPGMRVLF